MNSRRQAQQTLCGDERLDKQSRSQGKAVATWTRGLILAAAWFHCKAAPLLGMPPQVLAGDSLGNMLLQPARP